MTALSPSTRCDQRMSDARQSTPEFYWCACTLGTQYAKPSRAATPRLADPHACKGAPYTALSTSRIEDWGSDVFVLPFSHGEAATRLALSTEFGWLPEACAPAFLWRRNAGDRTSIYTGCVEWYFPQLDVFVRALEIHFEDASTGVCEPESRAALVPRED